MYGIQSARIQVKLDGPDPVNESPAADDPSRGFMPFSTPAAPEPKTHFNLELKRTDGMVEWRHIDTDMGSAWQIAEETEVYNPRTGAYVLGYDLFESDTHIFHTVPDHRIEWQGELSAYPMDIESVLRNGVEL